MRFGGHALFMLLGCCVIITCQDGCKSDIYALDREQQKKKPIFGCYLKMFISCSCLPPPPFLCFAFLFLPVSFLVCEKGLTNTPSLQHG